MAEYDAEVELNAHQERMQAFRAKYRGMKLKDLVEAMAAAQKRKENIELDLANANAEFDVLRFEAIPEKMEEDGVERVSYEGIGRVSLTADLRVATVNAKKPALFAWFEEHNLSDIIQPSINASTLKAFIKNCIKQGKPYPSELLTVTPITRASITKG